MKNTLTRHSVILIAKEQLSCDLGGEVAILNLKNGVYYGLDPVGARIWNLIQEPRRVSAVWDALVKEYDVEPNRCERDLLAFLHDLAAEGLVEVQDETAA